MADQPPQDRGERRAGPIGSLHTLAATLVAIAHTRLELAGTELREEFARLGAVLLWGYLALFFGSVAAVLVTFAVVYALGTEHRLIVLALAGLLFIVLAALAARAAVSLVRRKPRLFEASLKELEHDHHGLRERQ
jgi:uncharacterized membrane protein YqjE